MTLACASKSGAAVNKSYDFNSSLYAIKISNKALYDADAVCCALLCSSITCINVCIFAKPTLIRKCLHYSSETVLIM